MTNVLLNIRVIDRNIFDTIKTGKKTIETRAATSKFKNIKVGDILVFKCGNDNLEKSVKEKFYFKSIDEILNKLSLKEIMPNIDSKEDAKKLWYGFPNYKDKIKKHGIVAFRMK